MFSLVSWPAGKGDGIPCPPEVRFVLVGTERSSVSAMGSLVPKGPGRGQIYHANASRKLEIRGLCSCLAVAGQIPTPGGGSGFHPAMGGPAPVMTVMPGAPKPTPTASPAAFFASSSTASSESQMWEAQHRPGHWRCVLFFFEEVACSKDYNEVPPSSTS